MILNDSSSMEYFFKIGGIKNNLLNVNSVEVKLDGFLSEQTVSLKEDYNNLNYKNSKTFINKDSLFALADILIKNSLSYWGIVYVKLSCQPRLQRLMDIFKRSMQIH